MFGIKYSLSTITVQLSRSKFPETSVLTDIWYYWRKNENNRPWFLNIFLFNKKKRKWLIKNKTKRSAKE